MYVVYRDPLFYRAVIGEYFATLGLVVLTLLVRALHHIDHTDHTQSIHTQKRPNKHTDAPKTKY
jgi:fumarate reductase subunit D